MNNEIESTRAWIVVLGSFLMHFIVLGVLYSFSIFFTTYEEEFGQSRAAVSLAYTIGLGSFFTLGIVSGRLADMYGIRKVFLTGTILWFTGIFTASYSTSLLFTTFTHGLLSSIGVGLVYWPAVSIVPQWFDKRRSFALGIAVLGSGLGNLVFGFFGNALIEALGWRESLRVIAGVGVALLLVAAVCLKRRLPTDKKGGILGDVSVFKNKNYVKFWFCAFFFQFGYMVPFVHLNPYAQDLGMSASFGALAIGLIGAGSAAGRVIMGFIADKLDRLRVFRFTVFASGLCTLFWPLCKSEATISLYAVLYGFFCGGFIAMVPVIMAGYFGTQRLGGVMGYVNIAMIPGALGGPPLAGLAKDVIGSYTMAILISGGLLILAGLCILTLDPLELQDEQVAVGELESAPSMHKNSIDSTTTKDADTDGGEASDPAAGGKVSPMSDGEESDATTNV